MTNQTPKRVYVVGNAVDFDPNRAMVVTGAIVYSECGQFIGYTAKTGFGGALELHVTDHKGLRFWQLSATRPSKKLTNEIVSVLEKDGYDVVVCATKSLAKQGTN